MKKIIIILETNKKKNATFNLQAEGMHHYEILGLLRTAVLLQENNLIEMNIKKYSN